MVTRRQINQLAKRIAEEFHPERIILFGSYAYGEPTEDSDVDLLVVMAVQGDVVEKAADVLSIAHEATAEMLSVDILVRTPEQLAYRLSLNDFFLREIVEKGKVLFDAADSRVDRQSRRGLQHGDARASRAKIAKL